jgi:cytochrome c556
MRCLLLSFALIAGAAHAADERHDLQLTPDERAEFLAEMRTMLSSIQDIVRGIGTANRALITEAAQRSGNRLSRSTPESIRAKLPQAFRELGGPTHLAFEEIAIRAQTDEMDSLARDTADLMNRCIACHAAFRAH